MAKFRNIIGAVDGTHINIKAPAENKHVFVNRKGRHSTNVMVINNFDLIFQNL
jgi:hypothetical protein